jgi:hypothetical protein
VGRFLKTGHCKTQNGPLRSKRGRLCLWVIRVGSVCPLSAGFCCKTIFRTPARNIDSRSRCQPQHRFKSARRWIDYFKFQFHRLRWRLLQHNRGHCGHEFLRQGRDGPIAAVPVFLARVTLGCTRASFPTISRGASDAFYDRRAFQGPRRAAGI